VYEDDIESVLLTEEQVQGKVRDLAAQISKDYAGRDVLLVGVLKGAFILMADLARHLTVPHEFDFMAVSSYGSATQTSGVVRILKDLDREIQGRDVLIVEDIIDSGLTLNYLLKNLRSRRPATLEVCALLYKPEQLKADIEVKYAGFDIPSVFVVGYGLDYAERYRNLPFVGTLKPEVYRGRCGAATMTLLTTRFVSRPSDPGMARSSRLHKRQARATMVPGRSDRMTRCPI
jgi:hypoxanthine phosphoribosyltransferase